MITAITISKIYFFLFVVDFIQGVVFEEFSAVVDGIAGVDYTIFQQSYPLEIKMILSIILTLTLLFTKMKARKRSIVFFVFFNWQVLT